MNKKNIPENYDGTRLDRYMKKELPAITRSEMFRMLRGGKIKLNRKKAKFN